MNRATNYLLAVLLLTAQTAVLAADEPVSEVMPNIVYILCDDLGYGDVHCLGGDRSKIATPNIDRLAAEGMIFTDAHSGSSVCTPTRYGILTGGYAWRTRLQKGVLHGYSSPLIAPGRLTVPRLLKEHGYTTACIGKWHLGMGISKSPDELAVTDGPVTRGFDYYFGISASLDMPPYTFIENARVTKAPTATKKFGRKGAAAPDFEAVEVLPTLTRKAVEYIQAHSPQSRPFFLYLALTSPHTPILPTNEWQGKSGLSKYGDFVMQTDWSVGQVLDALEKHGLAPDTLVIFTSDNGCSPAAGIPELEGKGHFPSELRRGCKSDIWDGGHRIPFIARWPAKVKAGSRSDQLTCLTDLMATCADLVGTKLPADAGEDSVSILPALLGAAPGPLREAVVHHSIRGAFAIRQDRWKLELCPGSGGWSKGGVSDTPGQLYDMTQDVGERRNQYAKHPEVVSRLRNLLEKYVTDGRSTPGRPQKNDGDINLWKKGEPVGDATE
jgi:arylsulfatase A-like enzyme